MVDSKMDNAREAFALGAVAKLDSLKHTYEEHLAEIRQQIADAMGISLADTSHLMSLTEIGKDMYNPEDDSIGILYKDGTVKDISEASEILNVQLLSKKIRKYYLCYQRV
jgi:hypothetical protein